MVGTILPHPNFDAEKDCHDLKIAMKGLGTNESKIINILGNRSCDQRIELVRQFKTLFGKDLISELKSELSANFLRLSVYLLMPVPDFLAKEIKRAIKGSGTDERALVEILVGLDNNGILELKSAYTRLYKAELERDIVSETRGGFKTLAISLLQGNRDEAKEVDYALAKEDAVELFDAGVNRFGTDESNMSNADGPSYGFFQGGTLSVKNYECRFNKILVTRSYNHLKAVFAEYRAHSDNRNLMSDLETILQWRIGFHIANEDIEKSVKSEMSCELELGFISIVKKIKNTATYFAEELYKSMKGLGTDDDRIIRIVVWRSEIDLQEIKGAFRSLYAKSLADFIKEDTSGDYLKLLLLVVKP